MYQRLSPSRTRHLNFRIFDLHDRLFKQAQRLNSIFARMTQVLSSMQWTWQRQVALCMVILSTQRQLCLSMLRCRFLTCIACKYIICLVTCGCWTWTWLLIVPCWKLDSEERASWTSFLSGCQWHSCSVSANWAVHHDLGAENRFSSRPEGHIFSRCVHLSFVAVFGCGRWRWTPTLHPMTKQKSFYEQLISVCKHVFFCMQPCMHTWNFDLGCLMALQPLWWSCSRSTRKW